MTATTDSSKVRETLHAVLVNVLGVGVLISGESGLGKSDCVLELILSGQKLVADDVVSVRSEAGSLIGEAPEAFFGLLSVRGVGIVDVRTLGGLAALERRQKIDLWIDFRQIQPGHETVVLESARVPETILGVTIPKFVVHVRRSRSLRPLVELLARQQAANPSYAETAS